MHHRNHRWWDEVNYLINASLNVLGCYGMVFDMYMTIHFSVVIPAAADALAMMPEHLQLQGWLKYHAILMLHILDVLLVAPGTESTQLHMFLWSYEWLVVTSLPHVEILLHNIRKHLLFCGIRFPGTGCYSNSFYHCLNCLDVQLIFFYFSKRTMYLKWNHVFEMK